MREDNPNWFLKWEEDLPSPEELIPISQSLITPHLALAFQIQTPNNNNLKPNKTTITPPPSQPPQMMMSSDFGGGGDSGGSGDEPARTLKRPRLVWTPQLHKRFVDAVGHLGIKNAVPKTIMQLMSVEGLTRENVASHLQKYRLYLRRMQGGGGGNNGGHGFIGGGGGGHVLVSDSATDRLFASSPVPAHFLSPVGVSSDYLMNPYMPKNVNHQVVRNLRYDDSEFGNGVYGDGGRKILKLFPSAN